MRHVLLLSLVLSGCASSMDRDEDGVVAADDCDDDDASVFPGATEVCDGVDNDCDGRVDGDDDDLDAEERFADADDDGWGGASLGAACPDDAPGSITRGGDCDDAVFDVNPDATEICNGVDDDCDDRLDDADDDWDRSTGATWFRDGDSDGVGSSADFREACAQVFGYVAQGGDCDDGDPERYPGAEEICDGKDNNCDLPSFLVDDEDPLLSEDDAIRWWADTDGDEYGDAAVTGLACDLPDDGADNPDDCDDDETGVNPGAPELCNGFDDDCDGYVDADDWWDETFPYRVIVEVEGGDDPLVAPPLEIPLALLNESQALGDASGPAFDSVRITTHDCAVGFTEVPGQYVDGVRRVFTPGVEPIDASLPWNGSMMWRYDTDGDASTDEVLPAGVTRRFAVYFQTVSTITLPRPTPPAAGIATVEAGMPGQRTVSVDNGLTSWVLDEAQGGALDRLGPSAGPSVGAQTGNVFGNGMVFNTDGGGAGNGGWASLVDQGTTTRIEVISPGPQVAVVRVEGGVDAFYGGYDYAYTWVAWAGRPEIYAKVRYQLNQPSHVGPIVTTPVWTQSVRPWQIDNLSAFLDRVAYRDGDYDWVRAEYDEDTLGMLLGWRTRPLDLANPEFSGDGRFLALPGQDVEADPSDNEIDLLMGEVVLNHAVLMGMPYEGAWTDVGPDALRQLDGGWTVTRIGSEAWVAGGPPP